MPAFLVSILSALLSWWRGRNQAKDQQATVVKAYRDEAKRAAEPDKPWQQTVDDL